MRHPWLAACAASLGISCLVPAGAAEVPGQVRTVVLLHGLARTPSSMRDLASALEARGYRVCNLDYPSREYGIEDLASRYVAPAVRECARGAERVDFVTHSLGGIVVRQLAADNLVPHIGRVVMLGPPNHGSRIVDVLGKWALFQMINGPAGAELGTSPSSIPNRQGPPPFELGVIAGDRSINWVLSLMLRGANDGKVTVDSARLSGMKDFLVVHSSHPFLPSNHIVISQTVRFLDQGTFDHDVTDFGCFLLAANVASAQTSASGITIVSPASGTTVSPGTSVHVIVQVDPSVNPNTVLVATGGLATAYLSLSTAPYEGDLVVPSNFTGPLTVMALVRTNSSTIVEGPSITVNVAPADSPKSIELPGVVHLHVPGPNPDGARALTVMGDYADGSRRKISAGALGTTYSTSNPTVVTADVDGVLTATGSGIAYVTVQNGAARSETEVIVGNGSSNSVPVSEVTNQVNIGASGFRRDPDTGLYVQEVTIRNISALPIPKTLSLVIGGLPSGVVVANTRGKTRNVTPVGSYIVTVKSAEMNFLSPGSTGTALIEFRNPTGASITYTSRLFSGRDL